MGTEVQDIPRTRQVFYGTYASLPTTALQVGDLAFATDRKVLYRWNGSSWDALTFYSGSGLDASKPSAADLPEGSIYKATDTGKLYQAQTGAWVDISAAWTLSCNLKIKTETRDLTAASGDVSYTGYGFTPVALIIHTSFYYSRGFTNPTGLMDCLSFEGTAPTNSAIRVIYLKNGSDIQSAVWKSYDADGFTLTWTKSGTLSGTSNLYVIALKS